MLAKAGGRAWERAARDGAFVDPRFRGDDGGGDRAPDILLRPFPRQAASPRGHGMDLSHLGRSSPLPASPEEAKLDYVPNPRPERPYLVRFAAPEFTSLCPVTGQPDFAHLVNDYAPDQQIVES